MTQPTKVSSEEREALGLALRRGDIRSDGYIFRRYYKDKHSKVREMWMSPEYYEREKVAKREISSRIYRYNYALLTRYKTMYGCSECGYKENAAALQFDHIHPKDKFKEVSAMYTYSLTSIKTELAKCRILCANCHAIHTQQQRKDGVFDNENS